MNATRTTPAIDGSIMIDIWATAQYVSLFIQREMEIEGSTGEGLALLSRIGLSGPMTIREAASAMGEAFMTTSDRVRKLELAGEITKVPHPDDRRASLLSVSRYGHKRMDLGGRVVTRIGRVIDRHLKRPDSIATAVRDLRKAVQAAYEETVA